MSSAPRAALFSTSRSARIVSSTAIPAAQLTGLPPNVVPWALLPHRTWSAFEVAIAESGRPFAIALAMQTTSGTIPACSNDHIRPVRPKPAWTSSAMSRMPWSSQIARSACRNAGGAGM